MFVVILWLFYVFLSLEGYDCDIVFFWVCVGLSVVGWVFVSGYVWCWFDCVGCDYGFGCFYVLVCVIWWYFGSY